MSIGSNIYALRKAKKVTQAQLAEKIGVSEQAVSKWENDVCAPDVSLFPVIAGVMAIVAYLTTPILQTGESWVIQLVAAIAMTLGGLFLFSQWAIRIYKWFTVKKY